MPYDTNQHETGAPAWHAQRMSGIGGSDVAAVVGVSPWKTPLELWREKRGELAPSPDSPVMEWGRRLEPVIVRAYADATGRTVQRPPMLRHRDHAFMIGNLDGVADGELVLEAKAARTAHGWGEPGTAFVPQPYLLQVQHYMMVAGLPLAEVAVLIGGHDFRIYRVPADRELQALMIDAEAEFWRRVLEGDPPEPVTAEDMRQRWGRERAVGSVTATPHLFRIVRRLHVLARDIGTLERLQDTARADVMRALADRADTLVDETGQPLATWRIAAGQKRIDAAALRATYPDIAERFTKQGEPMRRFLLKDLPHEHA